MFPEVVATRVLNAGASNSAVRSAGSLFHNRPRSQIIASRYEQHGKHRHTTQHASKQARKQPCKLSHHFLPFNLLFLFLLLFPPSPSLTPPPQSQALLHAPPRGPRGAAPPTEGANVSLWESSPEQEILGRAAPSGELHTLRRRPLLARPTPDRRHERAATLPLRLFHIYSTSLFRVLFSFLVCSGPATAKISAEQRVSAALLRALGQDGGSRGRAMSRSWASGSRF